MESISISYLLANQFSSFMNDLRDLCPVLVENPTTLETMLMFLQEFSEEFEGDEEPEIVELRKRAAELIEQFNEEGIIGG